MMTRTARMVPLLAAASVLVFSGLPTQAAETESEMKDTVENCTGLAAKLRTKVADAKLAPDGLAKAEAFLTKMDKACTNRKFTEAGAAGLDVLIEIDAAKK